MSSERWTDRRHIVHRPALMRTIAEHVFGEESRGVLLVGEPGSGRTTLLQAVAETAAGQGYAVHHISGSHALREVEYGALAGFLAAATAPDLDSPERLTRLLTDQFAAESERSGMEHGRQTVLMLVDNGCDLDAGSVDVVARLVRSGTVRLAAACRSRPAPLPELARLCDEGILARVEVPPLNLDEVRQVAELILGGPMVHSASDLLRNLSRGNPAIVEAALSDARVNGALLPEEGAWVIASQGFRQWPATLELMRHRLAGCSEAAVEAATLISLCEPVGIDVAEQVIGAEPLRELVDHGLVESTDGRLTLWYPIFAEVARMMTPSSESLRLQPKVLRLLQDGSSGHERLLRLTSWSLNSGIDLPDEQLLDAAMAAVNILDHDLGGRALERIKDPRHQVMVRLITSRLKYQAGEVEEADALLDGVFEQAGTPVAVYLAASIAAAVRLYSPNPAEAIRDDIEAARAAAERLRRESAEPDPQGQDLIARALEMLELTTAACSSDYRGLGRKLQDGVPHLRAARATKATAESTLLVFEAAHLCLTGHPVSALEKTNRAFELLKAQPEKLLPQGEFILSQHMLALVLSGRWEEADRYVREYAALFQYALVYFGAAVQACGAWSLIRAGKFAEALTELEPAVATLRRADNQQLLGLSTAMKIYGLARLGNPAVQQELDFFVPLRRRGPKVLAYLAAAYVDAAEAMLSDATDAPALLELADEAADQGLFVIELEILSTYVAGGWAAPGSAAARRLAEAAARCEGKPAEALAAYGQVLAQARDEGADVGAAMQAGIQLANAGLLQLSAAAFRHTASLAAAAGDALAARNAALRAGAIMADLGASVEDESNGRRELSPRENEVVELVARGLSNREIAARLHLSVRTVEGHLYRIFAKRGVNSRADLIAGLASGGMQDGTVSAR